MNAVTPDAVGHVLSAEPGVRVAYLFGSRASGRAAADSDWDVAVLLEEAPDRPLATEARLVDRLRARWPGVRFDVGILNRADLFFQQLVVRTGRVIFEGDPERRIDFECIVLSRWCDFLPYHRRGIEEMLDRLRAGTYGRAG